MNVSRETFSDVYGSFLKKGLSTSASLSDLDLLPLVLPFYKNSYLLVDGSDFESVFSLLYKQSLPGFSVLTNRGFSSPLGFEGPLDRFKNLLASDFNGGSRLVLIDRQTHGDGFVSVFRESESFVVDSKTTRATLVGALERAGYVRSSAVLGSGDCSFRGSVVDFFPKELPFPVRVDFSFDSTELYRFNLVSQMTIKKIPRVSFVISLGGESSVGVGDLLENLDFLNLGGSVLSWGEGGSVVDLSICNYESYVKFNGSVCVSKDLSAFGVFVNGALCVPPWFLDSKPAKPMGGHASLFDGFADMLVGDYLIHEDYGVGVLNSITSNSVGEDSSLQITYADAKINVALSQIGLLSFFAKAGTPGISLHSISKKGLWSRRKSGVSKKIELFVSSLYTKHLSRIYSGKKRRGVDLELLEGFVSSFKFIDTVDQLVAYQDVLEDLTTPVPMDRLLCGDVGFGKTEIAIRAAFIAALQGERVVVLSPTTVLCHQLLSSFRSRLSPFSVNVGSVSRLDSGATVQDSLDGFNSGKIDVLVCTHRIFSFIDSLSNIGLLIIDEEHRFGVKQKGLFVEAFPSIDVLMMSATPIPRSLQSALSGLKTMSIISTPPINRKPIETSVEYFSLKRVVDYIKFEVSRGGQVYFLHNNIASLNKFKRDLLSLLSGVSVETIHAKMSPRKIKSVLGAFVSRDFDVLVATSIIENGLDIPNVNTVIINNAHLFGLSQLHQIRGRVGRHHRQAFAHLMVPRSLQPSGNTFKRLKAIEENIALGSGYVLSSKDLEIRGAGSVFGYAQSGGGLVGFDFYNKLVQRTISSKEVGFCLDQVSVNLFGDSATIPHGYVEDSSLRLSLYRRLALVDSLSGVQSFAFELKDRFGSLPLGVTLLIQSQEVRIRCFDLSILSIGCVGGVCSFVFVLSKRLEKLTSFFSGVDGFFSSRGLQYGFKKTSGERLLLNFDWKDENKDILVFISDFLNKFKNGFIN